MDIRACDDSDADAIWRILHPTLRLGETYALPHDMSRDDALAYWLAPALVATNAPANLYKVYGQAGLSSATVRASAPG